MAKKFRHKSASSGGAGSKIVAVNSAQGVKGIGGMQGTTRIIYDAVPLSTTSTNTSFNIFEGCNTRQFPLTNLTENKLQVGESIALERFSMYIIECANGTTNALGVFPLAFFPEFERLYNAQMSFNIAQDQVLKKLPLAAMYAPFNHQAKFYGAYEIQAGYPLPNGPVPTSSAFSLPHDFYKFDNNIIIPPQIEFYATVTIPPLTPPSGFSYFLAMKLSGLGSLYAPSANY